MKKYLLLIFLCVSSTSVHARKKISIAASTQNLPPTSFIQRILTGYELIGVIYVVGGTYWFIQDQPMLVIGVVGKTLASHFSKKLEI